jgi:hypothetical protein
MQGTKPIGEIAVKIWVESVLYTAASFGMWAFQTSSCINRDTSYISSLIRMDTVR